MRRGAEEEEQRSTRRAMGGGLVAFLILPKYYWRNRRRLLLSSLLLVCCFPVILPLFFLSFPFVLCLAASRFMFRSKRVPRRGVAKRELPKEEAEVRSPPLLQRYLEDQIGLVMVGIGPARVHRSGGDKVDAS